MIGEQIKHLRKSKRLSLRAFAKKTGLTYESIRYVESGRGSLIAVERIAAAYKRKVTLVYNDGTEIRLPGSLGRQLASVRRLLKKKRDEVHGISHADIESIETENPRVLVAMVELYAKLLSDDGVTLGLELRPLTKLDRIILDSKENAHVARNHC